MPRELMLARRWRKPESLRRLHYGQSGPLADLQDLIHRHVLEGLRRVGGRPIDMDCDNGFGSPEPDLLL